jgi:2-hydroxychromene-2-carboxylate isomerase
MDNIRFYFSFRSPYAWLAWHRIHHAIGDLPLSLHYLPVFPPENSGFNLSQEKIRYIREDVERMAAAYGMEVRWPDAVDTPWMRPHAAFMYALDQGAGFEFAKLLFKKRFSEGLDIGQDAVLKEAAAIAGLDGDALLDGAEDPAFQRQVQKALVSVRRDQAFGVPTFVFKERLFWGNDRIDWLLREIYRDLSKNLPDLKADPLARPF